MLWNRNSELRKSVSLDSHTAQSPYDCNNARLEMLIVTATELIRLRLWNLNLHYLVIGSYPEPVASTSNSTI
jgi:hypothetical protein